MAYEEQTGDLQSLFRTVLQIAEEVGLNTALKHLEKCVIERRTRWIRENRDSLLRSQSPLDNAYRTFYEIYLQTSVPFDGEIVHRSDSELVTRW
ncbi:MAG: hypothetical protein ACE5H4_07085 [Candidatus Thorarchaeota archaeon]